jgi:flagellum-specific peptidoglycan hydrolase FlgJ
MLRKLLLLFILIGLVGCGSGKSSSSSKKRPVTSASKQRKTPVRKPVAKSAEVQRIERQYEGAKEGQRGNKEVYSKSEILQATAKVKVTTDMVYEYIDRFKGVAQNNMAQYGIPASITLAQGILESGAGTGPLSVIANNHFGIKCHKEWTGPSVLYDDDAADECFRKYTDPGESYKDHSLFLTSRSRYASLFELPKDDYKQWAKGLKAAGYATDPKYPDKLISLIERYQLHQYDAQALGKPFVAPVTKAVAVNSDDVYQVAKGDTLYSISKRFGISLDDLKRKNGLRDNAISIGQYLKIK